MHFLEKECGWTYYGGHHLENTDQPLYAIKDGIVVVKKGAIIPNGFVI